MRRRCWLLAMAAALGLAGCGGSWQASFIWDGRDKDDDGGNLVIVLTELHWDGRPPQPAWRPVAHWHMPVADAPAAARAQLAQLVSVGPLACRPDLPAYALVVTRGPGQTRYLSDHAACTGAGGLPAVHGYVEQAALQRMAALLRQAH